MTEPVVREWMHEGVIVCAPETTLPEVAQTMKTHQISALVVVNADGLALGVISRTDLANAGFIEPYMRHWRGMTARHLMTTPVISVGAGTPVADALDLLRTRKIHRLVVTEAVPGGERPIGILSLTDVVKHADFLGGGLRPPSETSPLGLRGQSPRSRS